MVGGPSAGEVMLWDIGRNGATIKVAKMPDLPNSVAAGTEGYSYEDCLFSYEIHRLDFASGHAHHYAIEKGVPVVQALNRLWCYYENEGAIERD